MAGKEMVHLDGRTLEGGGQLLRIALSLSALTGIPVEIDHIRGNRASGGGLKAQHLACVKWLALACEAKITGAEKGSKRLIFEPGKRCNPLSPAYTGSQGGKMHKFESTVDIGTAGSTGLVLQAVLPFVLFAPPQQDDNSMRLHVAGGTNVSGSPSYEYLTQVLLPTLSNLGLPSISSEIQSRGWSVGRSMPGSFMLDVPKHKTKKLQAFNLTPTDLTIKPEEPLLLRATFLGPQSMHEHLSTVLTPAIQHWFGQRYTQESKSLVITCEDSGDDRRLYLIIVATVRTPRGSKINEYYLGRDWLYDRKIRNPTRSVTEMAERVSSDIHREWQSGAWVDEHMRDQLVVFQALADGISSMWPGQEQDGTSREPELHARTAEWVAKEMLALHFTSDNACEGIGFTIH